MELFSYQKNALDETKDLNRVGYAHQMGSGKTFTGAEKLMRLGAATNLIVCQKSKIDDWIEHFVINYGVSEIYNLTNKKEYELFLLSVGTYNVIGVINYELTFRRPDLLKLEHFTLMLDESSLIQNETAKRSKFILKLKPDNVILLSGSIVNGKYENLWSQMRLLGWNISKRLYWNQYIKVDYLDSLGRSIPIVTGYKNVDRLKIKMRQYGWHFIKESDLHELPEQNFITEKVKATADYKRFKKNAIVTVNNVELVGDTTLTKMLYERQLCGMYNPNKLQAFKDLVESTDDRLIVFYNFNNEKESLTWIAKDCNKPVSYVNGQVKDLEYYERCNDSITFIQYQAGAMGLNLQKANKVIYFTPPLSSELFEQSKKRIHRVGQNKHCFYYMLTVKGSIEEKIYKTLAKRQDFTERLFENERGQ